MSYRNKFWLIDFELLSWLWYSVQFNDTWPYQTYKKKWVHLKCQLCKGLIPTNAVSTVGQRKRQEVKKQSRVTAGSLDYYFVFFVHFLIMLFIYNQSVVVAIYIYIFLKYYSTRVLGDILKISRHQSNIWWLLLNFRFNVCMKVGNWGYTHPLPTFMHTLTHCNTL